jgi:hypothetical protein
MAKQTVITKKRRGPAPTGKGTLLGVRLQPEGLAKLDAWITRQKDGPTRPEAIRRLVEAALKVSEPERKAAKRKPRVPQPMVLKMPDVQTD